MSVFRTVKGLFGQLIHYKDGKRVGESWKGLFGDSYVHYNNQNEYVGRSDPGLLADQIHRDANGKYAGETWIDDNGFAVHYNNQGRVGSSYQDDFGAAHTYTSNIANHTSQNGYQIDFTVVDDIHHSHQVKTKNNLDIFADPFDDSDIFNDPFESSDGPIDLDW